MAPSPDSSALDRLDSAGEYFRLLLDVARLRSPSALLVTCDEHARPLARIHVVDCAPDAHASQCAEVLEVALDRLTGDEPAARGFAVALTRPGGEGVQPYDRSWFRAAYRVAHHRRLRVAGVYVVTRSAVRQVALDDAA